jgi:hypothetical protein
VKSGFPESGYLKNKAKIGGYAAMTLRLPSYALPWQGIILPLSLILFSVLDAYFTLICIHRGGDELNPFMKLAILQGPAIFLFIKMILTIIPAIVLSFCSQIRLAAYGLYLVNMVYIGIMYCHLTHLIAY